MNKKKALVIGSGFAGLSAAINLASKNFDVTVLEKNTTLGVELGTLVSRAFF